MSTRSWCGCISARSKQMERRRDRATGGFGRAEAVVVLAVVALLGALVAPAVQAARERARRTTCGDHLRQIGAAVAAYHDARGWLPPAAYWRGDGRPIDHLDDESWTGDLTYQNWAQLLLPYAGEQDLAGLFDSGVPVTHANNARGRTTELPLMACPSDTFHRPDNRHAYSVPDDVVVTGGLTTSATEAAEFARGNYAINGGPQTLGRWPGATSLPAAEGWRYEVDSVAGNFTWYGSGVAGINKAFRFADFKNGLATTVMFDEIRGGIHPLDPRGSWAFGQIAASITWGHGATGDDGGPNNQHARADDILNCGAMQKLLGPNAALEAGMPCVWYWNKNAQATARSMHPGGVQVLLADGAVRFAADRIDRAVWHGIHSREFPAEMMTEADLSPVAAAKGGETPAGILTNSATDAGILTNSATRGGELPERIWNSIGMPLVLVRPGAFTMGVPDEGWHDTDTKEQIPADAPPHLVRLNRPFYIGAYEVTQADYERVMGDNPSWHVTGRAFGGDRSFATDRLPVEQVTWNDAAEFCRRLSELAEEQAAGLSYRLPTEAEWEYVCRGGRSDAYRWTQSPDAAAGETAGPGGSSALPLRSVGSYPPNRLGVFDMRGNVYEWCQDWFASDYYRRSPVHDPRGPASGYFRVVRGTDWLFTGEGCPINRTVTPPFLGAPFLGFRVVAGPPTGAGRLADVWPEPGLELAVASEHRNPQGTELVLLDPADRHARLLRAEWSTAPSWHPSGEGLVFANGEDLFVLDLVSDAVTNLTQGQLREVFDPAWSPDGRRFVFSHWGQTPEDRQLCLATAEGQVVERLTPEEGFATFAAWSPDGRYLAYAEFHRQPSRPGDRGDLTIYDVREHRSRVISRGTLPQHEHARPAWRPAQAE